MANTRGFVSPLELIQHYADHGADFGATSPADYERMADDFWASPKLAHVYECTRVHGDVLRFDSITEAYCVRSSTMVIRTFFIPIPCSSLPPALRAAMKMSGDCHSEATNLAYFQRECKK